MTEDQLREVIARGAAATGPVVVLTGAGISAESGIPTFRGEEGYWRVGSRNYRPMELATQAAFTEVPDDVWGWYLYRRAVCREAQPNRAHRVLVELERVLGDRFLLVTQNVDGLHLRAGHDRKRVYQIHGNIDFYRCAAGCSRALHDIPPAFDGWARGRLPVASEHALLACPSCGGAGRPHVLWFDESYDEPWFRYESALDAALKAALLVVVGTSGATNLPTQMCERVARRGAPWVVVDPDDTPFGRLAEASSGVDVRGTACAVVPPLCDRIAAAFRR